MNKLMRVSLLPKICLALRTLVQPSREGHQQPLENQGDSHESQGHSREGGNPAVIAPWLTWLGSLLLISTTSATFASSEASNWWVSYTLRPDVALHQPIVRFGDIADIRSNNAMLTYQLANQPITYLSPAQAERRLALHDIENRLGVARKNQHIRWMRQTDSADQVVVRWQAQVAKSALGDAPTVRRGQWLNLHVRHGDIQVQTPAQALQNGSAGQTIAVRTRDGRAPILADIESSSKAASATAAPSSPPAFVLTR